MNPTTAIGGRFDTSDLDLNTGRLLFQSLTEEEDDALLASDDLPEIPGFDVFDQIGAGGGGDVYYGAKSGTMAPVAIKLLRRPDARRGINKPDWHEIDLLRRLRLHFVPRIHDYGVVDGSLYIVTDYVEGRDLATWCRADGRTRKDIVQMLVRVADAVQQLHERGVIHRDLKPSNVLVDEHGDPFILDFGLAEMVEGNGGLESAEMKRESTPRTGTPGYMAPEQARGDAGAISTRSDVYGLAAMSFVLLTGQLPHDVPRTVSDLAENISTTPARTAVEIDRSFPRPLSAVLAKGLSVQPTDRYGSAGDFAADLERWLSREPVEALEQSIVGRLFSCVRHRPGRAGAAAAITLLVGAVAVLGGWGLHERYEKDVALQDLIEFESKSESELDFLAQHVGDWRDKAWQEHQKKVNYARSVRQVFEKWLDEIEVIDREETIVEALEFFQGTAPLLASDIAPDDLERRHHELWVEELERIIRHIGGTVPAGEDLFYRVLQEAADNVAANKELE